MGPERGQLTDLRTPHRGSRKRLLYVDGDPWRAMTVGVVRALGLRVGDEIDVDVIVRQAHDLEVAEARERALRLLGYRERSVHELTQRLLDDGYPDTVVTPLIERLIDTGLLDDRRFVSGAVRAARRRGVGRARLKRDLARHAIDQTVLDEAIGDGASPEGETDLARALARRLARPGDTPQRLANRLLRRGFTAHDALLAAREALPDSPDHEGFHLP